MKNYYFPITIVKFPKNWNMNIFSLSLDKSGAIIFKARVLNSGENLMHSRDRSMTSLSLIILDSYLTAGYIVLPESRLLHHV